VRVLLDNCVPRRIGRLLEGHDVEHAARAGLAELANGELLRAAGQLGFDVLLTVDRNLERQQNLATLPFPVIVMIARRNTVDALRPLLPLVSEALGRPLRRSVIAVGPV